MGTVIIYATLLLNGVVDVVQYKGNPFQTSEACVAYLKEYNVHINKTLKEHIEKKEKGAMVLFIGCSEIGKLNKNETTT